MNCPKGLSYYSLGMQQVSSLGFFGGLGVGVGGGGAKVMIEFRLSLGLVSAESVKVQQSLLL